MPVDVSNNTLHIDGFRTSADDIVSYFSRLPDSEDKEGKLEHVLRLGVLMEESAGPAISIKHVEDEFGRLAEEMARNIDRTLGPKGEFYRRLEGYFGEGGTIKEILDPSNKDTPLYKLQNTLQTNIDAIGDKIMEMKGRAEEAKKGTQKGTKFEDRCELHLREIARPYSDVVERFGTESGELKSNKKGDFVVTVNGSHEKIVVEMKDVQNMSLPEIKEYLDDSMVNRDAVYGVMVFKSRTGPKEVGRFNEFDGDKLVCALSETDDDEESMWVLEMAYRWARIRATTANKTFEIDSVAITDGISKISESIQTIGNLKTQCKNINKSTDRIATIIQTEKSKMEMEMAIIRDSVKRQNL